MKYTVPQVFMIAQTAVDEEALAQMLYVLDVTEPDDKARQTMQGAPSAGEALVEVCGRLCYKSFEPGLNPNVTKVREGNALYIGNILQSKHGSVLEHATVTMAFINVTRVFTHELVRHRHGSPSQESLRYVRLTEIPFHYPQTFDIASKDDETKKRVAWLVQNTVKHIEAAYAELSRQLITDGMSFGLKKMITSALRRIAPIGLATNIAFTANHRTWRQLIEKRTSVHAEEEIRRVFDNVAMQMQMAFPNLYQDMEPTLLSVEEDPLQIPVWSFANSNV